MIHNKSKKHFPANNDGQKQTVTMKDGTIKEVPSFLSNPDMDGELYAYFLQRAENVWVGNGQDQSYQEARVAKKDLGTQTQIAAALGYSARTYKRHLDYFLALGYIVENKANKCYVLPNKEDYGCVLPQRTVEILMAAMSELSIKTYVLLETWWRWAGKQNEKYVFTNGEIAKVLGYKEDNDTVTKKISDVLAVLRKMDLINYVEFNEGVYAKKRLIQFNYETDFDPKKNPKIEQK